ncbi:proteasome [Ordospora pajunii]|uniref:proteasome n=1 Tax=Ordospora pajunii TaxID=3039483 RepID=UPI0029528B3D|nr:proteasome [Ordospora pajunii]KAH9411491.1 proteasome [Ordospora pajunii]
MTTQEEISNVFNSEGKIPQIKYGLEAVNHSLPVVTVRSKDMIVCAAKRIIQDKLEDECLSNFERVSERCFVSITGLPGDVEYIVQRMKMIANRETFSLGFEVTPDILCMQFADKMQKLIQSSAERPAAFSASIFGFHGRKAMIYQTDMSAIYYPCYSTVVGEKHEKMSKYIEKSYSEEADDRELVELAVGALLESLGSDSICSEMEVAYMNAGGSLKYLSAEEVDRVLQEIAEK